MFYKKVRLDSNKECFDFLSNHFTYFTMNSWNGTQSIANNVKLYNLNIGYDYCLVQEALEEDEYFTINEEIRCWEEDHPGYEVYFNGRSGGYLVLKRDSNSNPVFPDGSGFYSPCHYKDYEDWKRDIQENYGSLKNYHDELVKQVKLVQDFDKLCDDLITVCAQITEAYIDRQNRKHEWHATMRHQHFVYDTLEDLRLHKEYMLQSGYKLFDYDENELYAEYECNIYKEGEVILEKEN